MTEPLPTDALRRLEALQPNWTCNLVAAGAEHVIRQALLPWVAVPCGDEVLLVRITEKRGEIFVRRSVSYFRDDGAEAGTQWIDRATRFPDPLTALERLKEATI